MTATISRFLTTAQRDDIERQIDIARAEILAFIAKREAEFIRSTLSRGVSREQVEAALEMQRPEVDRALEDQLAAMREELSNAA